MTDGYHGYWPVQRISDALRCRALLQRIAKIGQTAMDSYEEYVLSSGLYFVNIYTLGVVVYPKVRLSFNDYVELISQ